VIRWIAKGEEDANRFLERNPWPGAMLEKTFAENLF